MTQAKSREQAIEAFELQTMLKKFFRNEIETCLLELMECSEKQLVDKRAYLKALRLLEHQLKAYIITYNHLEAKRQYG